MAGGILSNKKQQELVLCEILRFVDLLCFYKCDNNDKEFMLSQIKMLREKQNSIIALDNMAKEEKEKERTLLKQARKNKLLLKHSMTTDE
ncbi:MAG: hypothetical protein RSB59_00365 [Clostridia bacterium]